MITVDLTAEIAGIQEHVTDILINNNWTHVVLFSGAEPTELDGIYFEDNNLPEDRDGAIIVSVTCESKHYEARLAAAEALVKMFEDAI